MTKGGRQVKIKKAYIYYTTAKLVAALKELNKQVNDSLVVDALIEDIQMLLLDFNEVLDAIYNNNIID